MFFAAYHPKGQIPTGSRTVAEVNNYICKALGLKQSLEELSDVYYVDHTKVFAGKECTIVEDKDCPKLVVNHAGKELVIPGWRSYVTYGEKRYELPTNAVYMKTNKKFYIPKDILNIIR